jgi:LysR family pca operon transcriptional activator
MAAARRSAPAQQTQRRRGVGADESDAIRRIKYRHLRCLIELAECGKVTAAAEALNVTQPAVSKTVRELEEILQTRLFERHGAAFQLTTQGRTFLRYAEASLGALGDGVRAALSSGRAQRADVTIGALSSVAASFLPDVVLEFDRLDSALLRVITGPNTYLLDELLGGNVDFVVGSMPDRDRMAGLRFEHLYADRITFLVRRGHRLANMDSVDLRHIAEYPVLVPSALSNIRLALDTTLLSMGVTNLPQLIEAASPEFARGYVRKSDAIWAASLGASEDDVVSGRLTPLNLETGYLPVPVGVTTRRSARLSTPAQQLIECMRRLAHNRGSISPE